ncbi:benzoate 4-monooxygenase cytochrome P450 [Paramyrothecium foliicola]|nr:benzoate 4-monooxygenase cytochrome P450 [Paramyrothecium foliicola]
MSSTMPSMLSLEGALAFLTAKNLASVFGLWLGYHMLVALYNISPLHPLSKFPGPKLAAASYLYEAWYDLVKGGRYSWEIRTMHEKYGPIVRINPDELHCNDYEFVDEIYPSLTNRIRDKQPHFLSSFAGPLQVSTFASRDHETHRLRRSAIQRFFSRQGMLRYEPEIHEMAQKMCTKILRLTESGQVIDALNPFNCFTADAISQYCFGEPFGFLDEAGFDKNFRRAFESLTTTIHLFRHFPALSSLVSLMPALGPYLGPDTAYMVKSMTETIPNHVVKAQQDKAGESRRVFTEIMDAPIPDDQKTVYRLSGEGWSLVSAGAETTAASLCFITYFLLSQPEKLARLRDELKNEDPQKLSWVQLEKYPYLHGVIYEGIRLALGVPSRLPRIAREEDLIYKKRGFDYTIPKGTAIGMSAFVSHHVEEIFPEPEVYSPDRWIDANGKANYGMEKYIMSFSKGSRQCLGMNLAFCELYIVTAAMALRVMPHLKLHDTVYEDIKSSIPSDGHNCLQQCIFSPGVYEDIGTALACGRPVENECYCATPTALATVARDWIDSRASSRCAAGDLEWDITSMRSIYARYCINAGFTQPIVSEWYTTQEEEEPKTTEDPNAEGDSRTTTSQTGGNQLERTTRLTVVTETSQSEPPDSGAGRTIETVDVTSTLTVSPTTSNDANMRNSLDGASNDQNKRNLGIGLGLGIGVALVLAAIGVWLCLRRRKKHEPQSLAAGYGYGQQNETALNNVASQPPTQTVSPVGKIERKAVPSTMSNPSPFQPEKTELSGQHVMREVSGREMHPLPDLTPSPPVPVPGQYELWADNRTRNVSTIHSYTHELAQSDPRHELGRSDPRH